MTFELLKKMQGQMVRMETDILDLKVRMTAVEGHLGQLTTQLVATNRRIDRLEERVGRIERRFDLTDAQ
ncbi:MAG: hypothetical protein AAF899_20460 [Pseudomonadota bacterium]